MPSSQFPSVAEQMKALESLQELDLKIDRVKKDRTGIPAALKTLDDQLNKVKHTAQLKTHAIGELEKVQRQTQAALDLNKDRLGRSEGRLEGVQNTTEFQAASKEIEQLRKLNTTLGEQGKKTVSDIENANKDLATINGQLETLKSERDAQASTLKNQNADLEGELARLDTERKGYTQQIEPKTLTLYDRVRGARAGVGMAPAIAGRCQACNMMVPPQHYNEIQKGLSLQSCPSCHRILFIKQQSASAS